MTRPTFWTLYAMNAGRRGRYVATIAADSAADAWDEANRRGLLAAGAYTLEPEPTRKRSDVAAVSARRGR
jgi:hypothetical protein